MPHPERACEPMLGSADGLVIVRIGDRAVDRRGAPLRPPHDDDHRSRLRSRTPRLTPRRVRPHPAAARPRAEPHRARHVLGDVVRALQLQELARPPEDAADHRAARACRGPARTPAPSTSATGSPPSSRSSRTTTRRSSSRTRARRPASAASSATSSRWARGRSRCSTRCASGRSTTRRTRRIVAGVVAGIGGYGNCIGIPTVGGEIAFDETLRRQPAGQRLLPRHREAATTSSRARAEGVGNPVFYVGAKTGRDGIHGATMASAEFDETSAEKRPAVQVGDPFMEKLLLEACLEVMKTDALRRHPGHGRRGADLLDLRDGRARRHRHRDRRDAGAAARDRHDALRDHALRIAGAHAAGASSRAARRKSSGSSRTGICTPSRSATSPTTAWCASASAARSSPRSRTAR